MRILEVLPTYPGEPYDGSAIYERRLNAALLARGANVDVVATRARRLRHEAHFQIAWPDELPETDVHDGVQVRRFHALDPGRWGRAASDAVSRRWSREDVEEGEVSPGSACFAEAMLAQALRRPVRFDLLADAGRGPIAPKLLAHVRRQAHRYDLVIAGYAPFSLPRQVLEALSGTNVPVFVLPFLHDNDRYHYFKSLFRAYEEADAVLTLSEHTTRVLGSLLPRAKPVTLGAGPTIEAGDPSAGAEFRRRHGLTDQRILLFVGRKERNKRYDLAVDATEKLGDDVTLVMVGRDIDGAPVDSRKVLQLGLAADEELAAAYSACDVFVLPSLFESLGMVFLDAWHNGKPVIGNRACGAAAALIDPGLDGFLCADAAEIAAAASSLLEDEDVRVRMGEAGRAKTRSTWTWDHAAARLLGAFSERDVTTSAASSAAANGRPVATETRR